MWRKVSVKSCFKLCKVSLKQVTSFLMGRPVTSHFVYYITICHQLFVTLLNWEKQSDSVFILQGLCSAWHEKGLTFSIFSSGFNVDMMNILASEDTQVVYVCMKSSRTKLFLCMQTQPHWGRARLSRHNTWISIWNRCAFFFFIA